MEVCIMLELKQITFSADQKTILHNVDLVVPDGQLLAITGPNGGGKSTLARVIAGIEQPDSGQIIWNGQDITNLNITERAKLGLGYAFQQPVRFKGISVFELLKLAAGGDLTIAQACDYLSQVGLCAREYVDRMVDASLSGGELKRIEIATILARRVKLAVFDEPEAGIDLWSFQNLIQVFEDLQKNQQQSIVIISHQERLLKIADRIVVIEGGRVAAEDAAEKILPQLLNQKPCCKAGRGCEQA